MSRQGKFIKYWESIGRPDVEIYDPSIESWELSDISFLHDDSARYRIAGDRHWELRQRWIDSDFTLPIEAKSVDSDWMIVKKWTDKNWHQSFEYREAKPESFIVHNVSEGKDYVINRRHPIVGDEPTALANSGLAESSLNAPQPSPVENDNPAVWSLVIKDMAERDISGLQKYGTRLQPHNGRDVLVDAYQEALDFAVYLRQAIYERDGK